MNSLEQAISQVCHIDDKSNPEFQESIFEEIDEDIDVIIDKAKEAETGSDTDEEDDDGDLQLLHRLPPAKVHDVINMLVPISAAIQSWQDNEVFQPEERQKCFDILDQLQTAIMQAESSRKRKRMQNLKQVTLHDCFHSI